MSTLASNEKFIFSDNLSRRLFIILFLIIFKIITLDEKFIRFKYSVLPELVGSLYECTRVGILRFLIVYLFLTIVCVVKLVKFERGPLVKRL